MMNISVVIPLYNKQHSIARTVASVLAQKHPPFEIVVVDDGSTDRSREAVREFGTAVRLIEQRNAGPSAARNTGVRHTSGSHILFVDGDDELPVEAIEQHRVCLEGRPDVDVSLASFQDFLESGLTKKYVLTDRTNQASEAFVYLQSFSDDAVINVPSGSICVSRRLHDAIGGWDEALRCWEVSDYLLRAALVARCTGLHREIGLIVHLSNSGQFGQVRARADYSLRFSERIVHALHAIPESSRRRMLGLVQGFGYGFWKDGDFVAYHYLSMTCLKARSTRRHAGLVMYFGLMPVSCLKMIHRFLYRNAAHRESVRA